MSFSSGNFQEQGTRKAGVGAELKVTDKDTVRVRYDHEERTREDDQLPEAVAETAQTSVQWERRADTWGVVAELFSLDGQNSAGMTLQESRYGTARFWKRFGEKLLAELQRQQTLDGLDNNRTSVDVRYQAMPNLALEALVSDGDRGVSAQAGLALTVGESEIYLTQRMVDDDAGGSTSTVLGSRSPIGKHTRVYSEYQLQRSEDADRAISLVGFQRQWDISQGFRFLLSGEFARLPASGEMLPVWQFTAIMAVFLLLSVSVSVYFTNGISGSGTLNSFLRTEALALPSAYCVFILAYFGSRMFML